MTELTILSGHVLDKIKEIPDNSIHLCVTSPPYWGKRSYLKPGHPLKKFEIGCEKSPAEFVDHMVEVFREVHRVLRPDGNLFLNLGDTYSSFKDGSAKHRGAAKGSLTSDGGIFDEANSRNPAVLKAAGLKNKDLIGIPWMTAFALRDRVGFYLRGDYIWNKQNGMPESVRDRCTVNHEYIFHFAKSAHYFFDSVAIKEPAKPVSMDRELRARSAGNKHHVVSAEDLGQHKQSLNQPREANPDAEPPYIMANKRSVWSVPVGNYKGAHFATFPSKLILPCILSATSAKGACSACGAPWARTTKPGRSLPTGSGVSKKACQVIEQYKGKKSTEKSVMTTGMIQTQITTGWQPTCKCKAGGIKPCTVLDPFGGSGTTAQAAIEEGRSAVMIELNPESVKLIKARRYQNSIL